VDCGEDLACFTARARTCAPASVLHREQLALLTSTVHTVVRHEVVGWVRGRCHLRRMRLEPAPPPPQPVEVDLEGWPVKQPPGDGDLVALEARSPPLLQCLYPEAQVVEVLQRLAQGRSTPEDLELCYAGDGSCGKPPPLFPGCVLGDCLLGRWTYTCETPDGRNVWQCEGTRKAEAEQGRCASRCDPDGQEQMKCIDPEKWKRVRYK
jgi:hypothetical protein